MKNRPQEVIRAKLEEVEASINRMTEGLKVRHSDTYEYFAILEEETLINHRRALLSELLRAQTREFKQ